MHARSPRARGARGATAAAARPWLAAVFSVLVIALAPRAAVAQRTLGTEFWAADLQNFENGVNQPFGLAVANSSATTATVSVETAAGAPVTRTIGAGRVLTFDFDRSRMMALTSRAPNAYRVTSDVPVAVYQFNPLSPRDVIETTDASTLLPLPALGTAHRPHGRQQGNTSTVPPIPLPATIAIVGIAFQPTTVTVVPSGTIRAGFIPETPAGTPVTFTLRRFEVAQLMTKDTDDDLTGSLVTSDRPVSVFGGSQCSYVPGSPYGACNHLEEQAVPLSQWGTDFLAVKSVPRPMTPGGGDEPDVWRIVASEPNTQVTLTPDPTGASPITLAAAGDHFELMTDLDVHVVATRPVALAQYFVGKAFFFPRVRTGDPTMILAVPTAQFDTSYLFYTPPPLAEDYISVVAPTGTIVTLDGAPIPLASFTAIGATGYSRARLPVTDGAHAVDAPVGVGVYCYGYDLYDAYGFPAGGRTVPVNSAITCDGGGPYQVGCRGGTIALDASLSSGPAPLAYAWSSFSPGIMFADPTAAQTTATIVGSGPHVIAVTVSSGTDSATCFVEVEIVDVEPPDLQCPADVTTDPTQVGFADVSLLATVSDDCDPRVDVSNDRTARGLDASDLYPCGQTLVTWTATDDAGRVATCSTLVTVVDAPPLVTCPARIEVTATEPGGANVTVRGSVTDGCDPNPTITNDRTAGGGDASGFYPCGQTLVTFTGRDASGQTATCQTLVVVNDAPPVLSCPPLVAGIQPDPSGITLAVVATVSDFCDPAVVVTNDRTGGGLDATDTYTCGEVFVTFTARNASGLTDTCTTRVVVTDAGPTATCQALIEVEPNAPGGADVTVLGGATDPCDPRLVIVNDRTNGGADASDRYPCGETLVTFTATNAAGQSDSCTTRVVVGTGTAEPLEVSGGADSGSGPVWLWVRKVQGDPSQLEFTFEDRTVLNELYNLYEGTVLAPSIVAYDHAPLACKVSVTPVSPGVGLLLGPSDPGRSHYYLVSASSCFGEGTRGFRSDGVERPDLPTDCGPLP